MSGVRRRGSARPAGPECGECGAGAPAGRGGPGMRRQPVGRALRAAAPPARKAPPLNRIRFFPMIRKAGNQPAARLRRE